MRCSGTDTQRLTPGSTLFITATARARLWNFSATPKALDPASNKKASSKGNATGPQPYEEKTSQERRLPGRKKEKSFPVFIPQAYSYETVENIRKVTNLSFTYAHFMWSYLSHGFITNALVILTARRRFLTQACKPAHSAFKSPLEFLHSIPFPSPWHSLPSAVK